MRKKTLIFMLLLFMNFHALPYLNKNYTGVFLTLPFCYDFKGKDSYICPDFNVTVYCLSLSLNYKFSLNSTEKQIDKFNLFVGTGWGKHFQVQVGICDLLFKRKHISTRIRSDWQVGKLSLVVFTEQKRNCDELRWLAGIGIGFDLADILLPAIVGMVAH